MDVGYVSLDGFRHRYACRRPTRATAPAVVALHGFGTSGLRTYRYVAPHFAEAGVPLYAPDVLGFGGSDKPDLVYSLERYAALTAAFADALDLEAPVLLGHSMGAKIAAASVVLHPARFSGLVLVNPGGFSIYARAMPLVASRRWVDRLFRLDWFYHGLLPHTPLGAVFQTEENRAELLRLRGSHYALDLDATGIRPRLAEIDVPTLVLWGEDDAILPRSTPGRIERAMPGVRIHRLDGAGHAPMKDRPGAFTDAVARFARPLRDGR